MPYYVYLIPYRDASGDHVYVGMTNNPRRRLAEHDTSRFGGKRKRTGPMKLLLYCIPSIMDWTMTSWVEAHFTCEHESRAEAMQLERAMKRRSHSEKISLYQECSQDLDIAGVMP